MKIQFILNEQEKDDQSVTKKVNNDPKGRNEPFNKRLERIYAQNKHKYKHMFIRFTNLPERQNGINPLYDYDTPLGIYSYQFNKSTISKLGTGLFSFASDMKGIVIFGWNNSNTKNDTIIVDTNTDISVDKYKEYLNKITEYYLKNPQLFYSSFNNLHLYMLTPKTEDFIVDYNTKNRKFKYFDSNVNLWDILKDSIDSEQISQDINKFIDCAKILSKNNKLFTKIFNITRMISNDNSKQWTRVMRLICGISCIIDNGTGLIHPSEPYQAVFLEPHKTSVISVLENHLKGKPNSNNKINHDNSHLLEYIESNGYYTPGDKKLFLYPSEGKETKTSFYKKKQGINNLQIEFSLNYNSFNSDETSIYIFIIIPSKLLGKLLDAIVYGDMEKLQSLSETWKNEINQFYSFIDNMFSFGIISSKKYVNGLTVVIRSLSVGTNKIYSDLRKEVYGIGNYNTPTQAEEDEFNKKYLALEPKIIKAKYSIKNIINEHSFKKFNSIVKFDFQVIEW